ncbi:MAG: hypothetical protein IPL59_00695 [Candidatus Competibacteraceae bacterium]|nr:hypothetical protein [Candidatus Competibacteraceae bacterium]
MALIEQRLPQGGIDLRRMMAGLKQARIMSDHLFARITSQLAKSVVDLDDGRLGVGDHNAFLGVRKDAGHQALLFLGSRVAQLQSER